MKYKAPRMTAMTSFDRDRGDHGPLAPPPPHGSMDPQLGGGTVLGTTGATVRQAFLQPATLTGHYLAL